MRILFILFFVTIFNLNAISQNCKESDSKKAKSKLEKADNKSIDVETRIKYLKEAISEDENFAIAYYKLGMEFLLLSKIKGTSPYLAIEPLKKSIELCPEIDCKTYLMIGKLLFENKNFKDCSDYFTRFLKMDCKITENEYSEAEELNKKAQILDKLFTNTVPFNPKVIKQVCTYEDEFLPMLSPDNEILLFTKRYMKQGRDQLTAKQAEELFLANKSDSIFSNPKELTKPFNQSGEGYGGVTFSADNKSMFITICKMNKKGQINCDIYYTEYKNNRWSEFTNAGEGINTADGWEAQPTLSGDGKTLYFASARADSKKMDIYKSTRNEDGTWGLAENLGAPINTEGNEKTPFIHSDSQTLYFSSDGHTGVGGYDVYFSKADESGKFKTPRNIGVPINTEEDEVGFFVGTDGKYGYFSSNKIKQNVMGGWDVFSFELYEEAKPEKILFLKGKLKNENNEKPNEAIIEIKSLDGNKITKINVDTADGSFVAIHAVKSKEKVLLTVKQQGKAFLSKIIDMDEQEKKTSPILKEELVQKEIKVNKAFTIDDIQYKVNAAELTKDSEFILSEFAQYLNDNPQLKIEIRGHTDNVGNSISNMALSTDRAFTVYDFLLKKSIDKSRISFKGYGDTMPIAPNTTEAGRTKNRRTEFFIKQ